LWEKLSIAYKYGKIHNIQVEEVDLMERRRTFSGVTWESIGGYCRAIQVGNNI